MMKPKKGYHIIHKTVRCWKIESSGTYPENKLRPWIQQLLEHVNVEIGDAVEISDGVDEKLHLTLERFEEIEWEQFPFNPSITIILKKNKTRGTKCQR